MNKSFIEIILFLSALAYSQSALSKIKLKVPSTPSHLWLNITKIDLSSSELYSNSKTLELINTNGTTMPLVCAIDKNLDKNDYNTRSFIHYTNILNLKVAKFEIAHNLCLELYNYIETVFELIGPDYPIKIKLNVNKKFIEKIVLPDLNPYMDQLPVDYIKKINSLGQFIIKFNKWERDIT